MFLSVRRVKFLFSDIDECAIPELAGKCVDNAECCNLPAEYVCKCKPGFEGDGQVECRGKRKFKIILKSGGNISTGAVI